MDFNKVLFRASSWGNLLAEPKDATEKKAGGLGLSCKKELLKIYRKVVHDWDEDDITTVEMEKGTLVQTDSIFMYSRVMGNIFYENNQHLTNEWFCGTPDLSDSEDIMQASQVDDMKNSYLLSNYDDKTVENVTKAQECQLNVYYSLTGAQSGNIVHALMSLPDKQFKKECDRLLWRMANNGEIATEYAPEYIEAVEKLKKKFFYDKIPENERIFLQPVQRNDELIEKMKAKVPFFRKWLESYHKKRINSNKSVNLAQTITI